MCWISQSSVFITLKNQNSCFSHRVITLVADKLEAEVRRRGSETNYISMAVASGPAGPVLAGPLFHSNKFLLGFHQCFTAWQRKSLKCSTDFSHAFTSSRDSKLDIQGLETRPTHRMETGLMRAALLTSRVEFDSFVAWRWH